MMPEHTPEPWEVTIEAYRITVSAENHELSEQFLPEYYGSDYDAQKAEFLANARVMAAAPKLLRLLRAARDEFMLEPYPPSWIAEADAVIAEATAN